MIRSAITGVGACLPERVVGNAELALTVDTSDAWIRERTGISQRHRMADDQAVSDLATAAARLVLDEPSLGLARIVIADIYRTLTRLREEGLTILLIEQAATTAIAFADRTAVLVGGRIVLQGSRAELLASGDVVRHYLGITEAA